MHINLQIIVYMRKVNYFKAISLIDSELSAVATSRQAWKFIVALSVLLRHFNLMCTRAENLDSQRFLAAKSMSMRSSGIAVSEKFKVKAARSCKEYTFSYNCSKYHVQFD